ncbi:MAG: uncharacterized protein A8A55_0149 [Amphiamblys sp. WSBS2006]|nr:MAG: uncharacterized protein A8A55_0149 [Amphiamblys sp. WSBS2006]
MKKTVFLFLCAAFAKITIETEKKAEGSFGRQAQINGQIWTCSYLKGTRRGVVHSEAEVCYDEACDLLKKKLDSRRCKAISTNEKTTADILLLRQTVELLSNAVSPCQEDEFTPLMNLLANILLIKAERCVFCVEDLLAFSKVVLGRTKKTKMYCMQDKNKNLLVYKDAKVTMEGGASAGVSKEVSGGVSKEVSGSISKEASGSASREASASVSKEASGSVSREASKEEEDMLSPIQGSVQMEQRVCRKRTCM